MLDPNGVVEQFIYTAGGDGTRSEDKLSSFDIWSQSAGIKSIASYITPQEISFWYSEVQNIVYSGDSKNYGKKISVTKQLREGVKPRKFLKNKESDYETVTTVTREETVILEENFSGSTANLPYDQHLGADYRGCPERAPYRIAAKKMPDGRLMVTKFTYVNKKYTMNDLRGGNYVSHVYIFPEGTEVEDIKGLDLQFVSTIEEKYYLPDAQGKFTPPEDLPTLHVRDFKKKTSTASKGPTPIIPNLYVPTDDNRPTPPAKLTAQAGQTAQRQPAQKQPAQRQATQQPQQKPAQQTTQQKPAQTTAQPQQNAQQTAQAKQPQQTAQQKQPVQPKPVQQKPVGQTAQQQKPAAQKPVQTTAQPQKPAAQQTTQPKQPQQTAQKPVQQKPAQQTTQPKPANIPPYTFDQLLQECAMKIVNYQSRLSSATGTRKKELEEEIVKNLNTMRARVAKLGNDALTVWANAAENNMQIALLNVEENCNRTKKPFVHSEATNDPNYKAAASLARVIHSERVKRGLVKTDSNKNTNSNTKK